MALTFTLQEKPMAEGHRWRTVTIVAADASYTTGYSMKATDLGLGPAANTSPDLLIQVFNTYGYGWRYDYANQKLIFYASAGTLATNPTDLSALTDIRVVAYSKFKA